jgi:E3 ubiquitin-protein ligase DOA10
MSECRICYEDSTNEVLINPCACAGSQKWIHESCLQRWRRMNNNNINRCELCLNNYIIIRHNQEVYFIKVENFHYSVLEMVASLM